MNLNTSFNYMRSGNIGHFWKWSDKYIFTSIRVVSFFPKICFNWKKSIWKTIFIQSCKKSFLRPSTMTLESQQNMSQLPTQHQQDWLNPMTPRLLPPCHVYYWSQIDKFVMYYDVVHVTNLVVMATVHMVNVMTKYKRLKKKHTRLPFL